MAGRKRGRPPNEQPEPKPTRTELLRHIDAWPRMLAGYWTTKEIAGFLGISSDAINMQVHRGKLKPMRNVHGQTGIFSDEEVRRYMESPGKKGRPRKASSDG